MSTTVGATVRDALLILRVEDAKQPVKPQNMADGIRVLNQMMRRWEADGLSLGWFDVSNPSQTLPAPPEAEGAISDNLALWLRPRFGVALDPDVVSRAMSGLSSLGADVASNTYVRLEYPDLPYGEAQGYYNWRAGYNG